MEMPKVVRMADISAREAAKILVAHNCGEVAYLPFNPFNLNGPECGAILSVVDPRELTYPEGWYFAKGNFRNKHNTVSGRYEEIPVYRPNGEPWK